jgi:pilus assembly protein CpaB
MVAIAIPIDRFSSVGYGVQRGDHVNIIVSMLFVDIDTDFQTILPNSTSGVIAPGNTVLGTLENEDEITATLTTNEDLQSLTAQSISGGIMSPQGRTEFDGVLNQPLYIVPSETTQRPRLVSQTILQDVIIIHVGDFPLSTEEEAPASIAADDQPQPGDPNAQPQDVPEEGVAAEAEPPDIITLMVFPQEAVTLNYLVLRGAHLTLVMRASGDDSRVFTEAVTLDWLLAQHSIPVPSRLPYGFEPSIEQIISPAARDIIDLILSESENQ